jgi:hypothetical protein
MRGLFVLLLLTNFLFLGWQIWFEIGVEKAAPFGGVPLVNEGLSLFTELEEEKRPPQRKLVLVEDNPAHGSTPAIELVATENTMEETFTVTPAPPVAALCFRSTSLVTVNDANALQRSLAKIGIKESRIETVQTQNINYWVMLPAYKNKAMAKDAADILKESHVKDFFILHSGDYENSISLGVYSTRERAKQRYLEIGALNARLRKAVIEAIELPAKRLVVTFQVDDGTTPEGILPMLDSSKEPYLQKILCK